MAKNGINLDQETTKKVAAEYKIELE